jgi:hypothetical protein
MNIEIKSMLPWGTGKRVQTARGERIVSTAQPNESFWASYKTNKAALNEAGVSVGKNKKTGEWEVCWWQSLPKEEQEARQATAELSRKADTDFNPPCNEGLSYLPFQRAGIQFALKAFGFDFTQTQCDNGHRKGNTNYAERNICQNAGSESRASAGISSRENEGSASESRNTIKDQCERPGVAGDGIRTNETCDAQAGSAAKAPSGIEQVINERNELQGRQWTGAGCESEGTGDETGTVGIRAGISDTNEGTRHGAQSGNVLQSGLRTSNSKDSGGGGWAMPPPVREAVSGRKENGSLESSRMDVSAGQTLISTKKGNCPSPGVLIADEMGL